MPESSSPTRHKAATPSSQPAFLRRVREGGLSDVVFAIPALYVLGAFLLALALLTVDSALGETSVPEVLRFGEGTAQMLLSTLAGTFLTVVALVFWVRMLAVSMASEEFSSRVLRPFLNDAVHQHTMGFVVAGLTYCLVVLRAVPDQTAGMATVPHLSVLVGAVGAVAAAGLIVAAIHSGARQSQVGHLVRWLADATVRGIRRNHPQRTEEGSDARLESEPPSTPDAPARTVRSERSGWVQQIREDELLAALSPGGVAQLDVRAGAFVVEGTALAHVWAEGEEDANEQAVRAAIRLGVDPTMEQDVSLGIRHLVDIAERALDPGSGDSTTALEVIVHLGLVLRELLLRDLPAPIRTDERGRTLLRPQELSMRELIDTALSRIRVADTNALDTSEALLDTLGMLIEELEGHGLHERAAYLRYHAGLVVASVERKDLLEDDKQRVRDRARRPAPLPAPSDSG